MNSGSTASPSPAAPNCWPRRLGTCRTRRAARRRRPKPSSAACCTTWAKSRSTPRCPRALPASSKPPTCSAATSPTSSGPSSAWTTWSSASGWPSGGNCRTAVRDCIWLHGQLPQALPATVKSPRLVNLVTLADLLVREQHLGYSGNYTFPVPRAALMEAAGLSGDQVAAALVALVGRIEPRSKALGLGESSSGELYLHALTQANKELGRVGTQLAAKNRKLTGGRAILRRAEPVPVRPAAGRAAAGGVAGDRRRRPSTCWGSSGWRRSPCRRGRASPKCSCATTPARRVENSLIDLPGHGRGDGGDISGQWSVVRGQ